MDPAPTEPRLTRDQQALVERAAHRVPQIARQIRHLLGGVSFEECESAGYEALVRSALRYDPSLGVPFTGYAYPRVRGAMLDAARRASPDRRRLTRAIKLVEAVEAARANHEAPALAGEPRSLRERVEAAAAMIREVTTAVVLTRVVEAEPERLADTSAPVDEVVADEHTRQVVQRAMQRCEPEDRALLAALYFGEQTMHEYAAAIGVNVSTVSRRHSRALARLAAWFAERPP
ncbi:MAG: sigma-70 family RNA polymerase sigma factor [Myxococcales bacterium]|nr:sigma-70 family RNA polymerase sigma factor [Myxococcales bacterium]